MDAPSLPPSARKRPASALTAPGSCGAGVSDPTGADSESTWASPWAPTPLVSALRRWATARFRAAGVGIHEVRLLLEWALGMSLLAAGPRATSRQAETFRTAVLKRCRLIPLQHVMGRMWFRTLELEARPGVFVVRPETEVVAGLAIDAALAASALPAATEDTATARTSGPASEGLVAARVASEDTAAARASGPARPSPLVVDLCTGSGAIALSIAAEVPHAHVVAVELSAPALNLAQANRSRLEHSGQIRPGAVHIIHADALDFRTLADMDGQVDVVVSNPPYVPGATVVAQAEARHDPVSALYGGGEDGMVTPRGIITRAAGLLKPGGTLVMEHAESQADACRAQAHHVGLVDVGTRRDLAGRPRALVARKPGASCDNGTVLKSILIDASNGVQPTDLLAVVKAIGDGQLVVLPTDTVYGIGADAANPKAVMDVLAAKGRGRQMPPPVLVAHADDMDRIAVNIPQAARNLAQQHWPGGLTLILQARPDLGWDLGETGGTIALRMPNHPVTLEVLAHTGPMAVTSANLTGQPSATTCQQAQNYFGDQVSAYVDAGPTPGSTPSTIIDCAHGTLTAIRLGTLDVDTLSQTAGEPITQK